MELLICNPVLFHYTWPSVLPVVYLSHRYQVLKKRHEQPSVRDINIFFTTFGIFMRLFTEVRSGAELGNEQKSPGRDDSHHVQK